MTYRQNFVSCLIIEAFQRMGAVATPVPPEEVTQIGGLRPRLAIIDELTPPDIHRMPKEKAQWKREQRGRGRR